MKRPSPVPLVLAWLAPLAAAAIAADTASPPDCAKCSDIAKIERELAQQKAARDAFREFTYDAVGPRQTASSVRDLQTAHAALFSQMMSGGKKGKGKGRRIVAQAALETDLNDCTIYEVLPNGKKVPLDEAKYRQKLCLFADFLIEHEKDHVQRYGYAHKEGLASEFANPVNIAELEMKGYQAGIDLLEKQLAGLKSRCMVAGSGLPSLPPGQALASAVDAPALQQEIQLIGRALGKGWG